MKLNGGVGGGAWFGSGTGRFGGAGDVRVGVVMKSARHGGGALLELRDGTTAGGRARLDVGLGLDVWMVLLVEMGGWN